MNKNPLSIQQIFQKLPSLIMYLGLMLLIIDEFWKKAFSNSFLKTESSDFRISVAIAVLTFIIVQFSLKFAELKKSLEGLTNKYLGVIELLPSHEQLDFKKMLENNDKIKMLTLSGTKVVSLGDVQIQEVLMDPKRKSEIMILLANPFATSIVNRYQKDEPDTYETGVDGIKRRLISLRSSLAKLTKHARKKIIVKVYDNYPVVSILQVDNDIYSTSYGYKLRGGDCPKLHSDVNGEYGKFLCKHFNKVYNDAVDLEVWFKKYEYQLSDKDLEVSNG